MRIKSIEIEGMWSFGAPAICLRDLGPHNVIIGKNNSGKSNVLKALRWVADNATQLATAGRLISLPQGVCHDTGDGEDQAPARLTIRLDLRDDAVVAQALREGVQADLVNHLIDSLAAGVELGVEPAEPDAMVPRSFVRLCGFEDLRTALVANLGASPPHVHKMLVEGAVPQVLASVMERFAERIRFVSGWRSLQDKTYTGQTLIKQLELWHGAEPRDKQGRRLFQRVEALFSDLMRAQKIGLVPQHGGGSLNIDWRGRYLPIESFGDGVHHLLMLAFELASTPDCILLIEEPETHLHPEAQRHLVNVVERELTGQSIITTHSPVLLDAGLASNVYRVQHDGDKSSVQRCETTEDHYQTLDLLDVRASDLLQANIVVWVEGPTDRMFLRKCLEVRGARFVEGLHYLIACYAGSLRAHVTFDEGMEELVNLLRLSRHVVMVCDSDRDSEATALSKAKERLREECERVNGLYWVTDGREIENYIPDRVLTAAYRELLGDESIKVAVPRFGKLSQVLADTLSDQAGGSAWKVDYERNKVRIMPHLLKHLTADDLKHHDLDTRVDDLIDRIKQANKHVE